MIVIINVLKTVMEIMQIQQQLIHNVQINVPIIQMKTKENVYQHLKNVMVIIYIIRLYNNLINVSMNVNIILILIMIIEKYVQMNVKITILIRKQI